MENIEIVTDKKVKIMRYGTVIQGRADDEQRNYQRQSGDGRGGPLPKLWMLHSHLFVHSSGFLMDSEAAAEASCKFPGKRNSETNFSRPALPMRDAWEPEQPEGIPDRLCHKWPFGGI